MLTEITNQIDQTVTELGKENFDDYVESRNIEEEIEQDIAAILAEILGE